MESPYNSITIVSAEKIEGDGTRYKVTASYRGVPLYTGRERTTPVLGNDTASFDVNNPKAYFFQTKDVLSQGRQSLAGLEFSAGEIQGWADRRTDKLDARQFLVEFVTAMIEERGQRQP